MSDSVCHISPKGGVDDKIAAILNQNNVNKYTKEDIGALRGLYDQENSIHLIDWNKEDKNEVTDEEIAEASVSLAKYIQEQNKRHLSELKNSTKHPAKAFKKLYDMPGWDPITRRNRINAVALLFSNEVTRRVNAARKRGVQKSREEVANGYYSNDEFHDGQFAIFEAVFDKLFQEYKDALNELNEWADASQEELLEMEKSNPGFLEWFNSTKHLAEENRKMLANWAAICTFARMSLRDTESLKLGTNTLEYALPTTEDNFSLEAFKEDGLDLEQSVREAWQELLDRRSSFASMGKETRRFLSTVQEVDAEGNPRVDDLGYPVFMDPLEMHQYLADALRGVTTESKMIKKLSSLSDADVRIKQVFDKLAATAKVDLTRDIDETNYAKNPQIITQLLLDLHKNMVPFSALKRSKKSKSIYARVLNRQSNPLEDEFLLRLQNAEILPNAVSVFETISDDSAKDLTKDKAVINWERLAAWFVESNKVLPQPKKKDREEAKKDVFAGEKKYAVGFYSKDFAEHRKEFLISSSRALGIPMSQKAAARLLNNKKLLSQYTTALQEFTTYATLAALEDENAENFKTLVEDWNVREYEKEWSVERRRKHREALEALNKSGISYKQFLTSTYGNVQGESPGFGMEQIYKMLGILASMENNLKMERGVPWYDRKGRVASRYSDQTPSYMGDLVDKLHEFVDNRDAKGLKEFVMDRWGSSTFFYKDNRWLNKWVEEFYESIQSNGDINVDALAHIFMFDDFLGEDVDGRVDLFENFTEKKHIRAMIKQFVLPRFNDKNSSLAKYPCFILGDSGKQRFFTSRRYSIDKIREQFKNIAAQEKERIKYVKATNNILLKDFAIKFNIDFIENNNNVTILDNDGNAITDIKKLIELGFRPIENFSETANEFTQLPFLNSDFEEGKYWKMLTGKSVIPESKAEAMQEAKDALGTDAFLKTVDAYMEDSYEKFRKKLVDLEVLKEVKKNGENGETITTYTDVNGYFKYDLENYYKDDVEAMLRDFYWNTKYATIQQIQLFTVDPAFYNHEYPIKDLQKRYKEIYAPGKGVSTEARNPSNGKLYTEDPYETAVYFDDIEVSSEDVNPLFLRVIEKTFGKDSSVYKLYTKNTLTDGQGYRTLDSYRKVMGMSSQWTPTMETAYNRIIAIRQTIKDNGGKATTDDIMEIAELAVMFQPIKPYLYTLEKLKINDNDCALIPVQHKYAEIVLIPELMADGKLRDLALWMENHKADDGSGNMVDAPIDLVASTKCVKVGAFGSTVLKGADTTEKINDAMNKAFVHKLAWEDYRIQSGVPAHLDQGQLFGTQPRKLILDNINKSKDSDYQRYLYNIFKETADDPKGLTIVLPDSSGNVEVHLNGPNLISLYNCLIMANLFDSFDELSSKISSDKNLSDILIQTIVSNANQAEDNAFAFSIIEKGMPGAGELLVPLGEPGVEHDATALLFSLFTKLVNKQKIKGGSIVQASAMGISGFEESGDLFEVVSPDGSNVLYDELEMPWNKSYTTNDGKNTKTVQLEYTDWCNPDGTLKLADGKDGRPLVVVNGEDAHEFLSWPVGGRDSKGRPAVGVDENGYAKQGYYKPLIELSYPGALDTILYRIPTEKEYSMINGKVFRFSNPIAGGTGKVPSSRTTTAGFDFDIDKLYFFMKEFMQRRLSDKETEEIWEKIYSQDEYREFAKALQNAKEEEALGNSILNKLSTVFGHSPLAEDLSNKNQAIKTKKRNLDFWETVKQNDSEGKFSHIPATAEEAFTKYLEKHRSEYPNIFETYNRALSPLENTRAARNNMLIDLFRQRLQDPETLKSRYTPGGFNNNREAALRMRVLLYADRSKITDRLGRIDWDLVDDYVKRINDKNDTLKDPEPTFDFSDPLAILAYNQQNQIAAKLIGIFANQNTNHVYASLLHTMRLANPIKFGNHATDGLSDFLHAPEGIDVGVNMAEYLAASVDAVKDPVLNFLNLNMITADAASMLARIGYTPNEIGLLFNQPIIKDVCNYIENNGVTNDVAIANVMKEYGGKDISIFDIKHDDHSLETSTLANNILQNRAFSEQGKKMDEGFKRGQLQVLALFNEILADAQDLNSFVQSTRFTAANSVGSTWGHYFAQEERINNFVKTYKADAASNKELNNRIIFQLFDDTMVGLKRAMGILNIDEKLLNMPAEDYMKQMARNPLAFEQCMMDMYRKTAKQLFRRHFPFFTDLYTNMRSYMNSLAKYGSLDEGTIDSLHRDFISFILSRQAGSKFDGDAINLSLGENNPMTNREYYVNRFPQLMEIIKTRTNVPFFQQLKISANTDTRYGEDVYRISVPGMGGLQSYSVNRLQQMWAAAYKSSEVIHIPELNMDIPVSKLAEDLYFYNFYTLGYNFHPTAFMNLAPTVLKLGLMVNEDTGNEMSYIEFVKSLINGKINLGAEDIHLFAKQYILNHLDNYKFVFTPKGIAKTPVSSSAYNETTNTWKDGFNLNLNDIDENLHGAYTLSIGEKAVQFRPVIAIETDSGETLYYIADSSNFNVASADNPVMHYKKVRALGKKGDRFRYLSNSLFSGFMNGENLIVEKQNKKGDNVGDTNDSGTSEEDSGTLIPSPSADDGASIERTVPLLNRITDSQWAQMHELFKQDYSRIPSFLLDKRFTDRLNSLDKFKKYFLSNPESTIATEKLEDLYKRIDKGEQFDTIDDKGEDTKTCPILPF